MKDEKLIFWGFTEKSHFLKKFFGASLSNDRAFQQKLTAKFCGTDQGQKL